VTTTSIFILIPRFYKAHSVQDNKYGEVVIQAPALNSTVEQDLHMIAGLLRLGTAH
jgi:hypothetical protein